MLIGTIIMKLWFYNFGDTSRWIIIWMPNEGRGIVSVLFFALLFCVCLFSWVVIFWVICSVVRMWTIVSRYSMIKVTILWDIHDWFFSIYVLYFDLYIYYKSYCHCWYCALYMFKLYGNFLSLDFAVFFTKYIAIEGFHEYISFFPPIT